MQMHKQEKTRGFRIHPRENLKFKLSEMARNASKTGNVNLELLHPLKRTSYDPAPIFLSM